MKKIKLLIVTSHLWIGGAETIIASLCRHLDRDKFSVDVCCLVQLGEVGQELANEGFNVFPLRHSSERSVDYFTSLKLLTLIKKEGYDIIHSHTTHSLIDMSICRLLYRRICTLHTFHYGNYPNYNKKYLFLERLFCRFNDCLVAVGEEQKKRIMRTFRLRKPPLVIRNGVTSPSQTPSPPPIIADYITGGKVIIGAINTLIEQKGTTDLIDVAYQLKKQGFKTVFLIVGEGPLWEALTKKTKNLHLEEDVIFLGWVRDAANKIMPHVDIFFQPSLWEAMSVVVLEAMVCGKPVVVSDVGENSHVIEDGVDGLLVQPRDIQGMAAALASLVASDVKRTEMGAKARKKAMETFNIKVMIRQYEVLYQELLEKESRGVQENDL